MYRVYCTVGKLKQISNGERNTIVRLTVTNLLYIHISITPPLPEFLTPYNWKRWEELFPLTLTEKVQILCKLFLKQVFTSTVVNNIHEIR